MTLSRWLTRFFGMRVEWLLTGLERKDGRRDAP